MSVVGTVLPYRVYRFSEGLEVYKIDINVYGDFLVDILNKWSRSSQKRYDNITGLCERTYGKDWAFINQILRQDCTHIKIDFPGSQTKVVVHRTDEQKLRKIKEIIENSGSRKRRDQFLFTKNDIALMLDLARQHGHKDMINKLTPKKDLKTIKRELIISIRHGKTDQDLWSSYCDAIQAPSTIAITV